MGISVGGFTVLSLILLLIFLCRRKRAQRRGDRLLSPFATNGERETAELSGHAADTGTGTEDVAAAAIFPGRRPRSPGGAANGAGVNYNRGPPQFLERPADRGSTGHRPDELAAARPASNVLTVQDRVLDWWTRRAEDKDFNTRVRLEGGMPVAGHMGNKSSSSNTLPVSARAGHGLRRLGGNLDPFSDRHATSGEVAYYSPRAAAAGPSKPFSDAAARSPRRQSRGGPAYPRYGPGVGLQSRGRSHSATARNSQYPPPSMAFRLPSAHRESVQSVDSFADRRNKFRSDPFDLEIQSLNERMRGFRGRGGSGSGEKKRQSGRGCWPGVMRGGKTKMACVMSDKTFSGMKDLKRKEFVGGSKREAHRNCRVAL